MPFFFYVQLVLLGGFAVYLWWRTKNIVKYLTIQHRNELARMIDNRVEDHWKEISADIDAITVALEAQDVDIQDIKARLRAIQIEFPSIPC